LWRDWVIKALNDDVPYDQFVRAQLTGYRTTVRTQMAPTGHRMRKESRPDDLFALGFLARGAVFRNGAKTDELAIAAVETVSTAFMGLTVGCAKCHDHFYDPISKQDFYAMKALFDPLVLRKVTLASAADLFASGQAQEDLERKRAEIEGPMNELIAPYKDKLYEERVAILPPDAQAIIRKPEKERTAAEQKIADDYFPVIRIDPEKIEEVMPKEECAKYKKMQEQLKALEDHGGKRKHGPSVPAFWTVEVDSAKVQQKSYVLTSGDPERPEKNHEVAPGWPFAPAKIDFREGRIEAFSDWLTTAENPMFARVAVNRLWRWHFGEGLQKTPSDFGTLGGKPSHPQLLDWLASEFVKSNFSMKSLHMLIVTSRTYQMSSEPSADAATQNRKIDPDDTYLWHFRLQRLEAEPIWDSILSAAGELDFSVGGPSADLGPPVEKQPADKPPKTPEPEPAFIRRAAYIARGYQTSREIMPHFLHAFDVDDGRAPCPLRTQTVTAPQSLFLMNSPEIDKASKQFAERLQQQCGGDLKSTVELAYRIAIARPPVDSEQRNAQVFLENDPTRLKDFTWLLFNLDEFIYVR